MEVMRAYLRDHDIDFRWTEPTQQYQEWLHGRPRHEVRGFTKFTLEALYGVLRNSYATVNYLVQSPPLKL